MLSSERKPLLITSTTAELGKAFSKICHEKNISHIVLSLDELDICDLFAVRNVLDEMDPWAVVNASDYGKMGEAENGNENEKEQCFMLNVHGPTNIAMACREKKIPLLIFSSDLVFDGKQNVPYNETNELSPLNFYGQSKADSEEKIMAVYPQALIIRSSTFFGPMDEYNFVSEILHNLISKKEIIVANDCKVTPTYVPDLANAAFDLLINGASGVYHLTNKADVTWAELAHTVATKAHEYYEVDTSLIIEKKMEEICLEKRPLHSCLTSIKGLELPSLEDAIGRYFTQLHS